MILRRIYQNKPSCYHRQLRCLYSSTAPPSPSAGAGAGQRTSPFLGFLSQACIFQPTTPLIKFNDLKFPYDVKRCCFSTQALANLPVTEIVDVPLAQTGEGIAECEMLKWFVEEGDEVDEFQPLCEVQSDKATIEITSRYKGKVSQILHVPGDIVKVGETLLKMVVEDASIPLQAADTSKPTEALDSNIGNSDGQSSVPEKNKLCGILSTPAVRNLAKQYGIDINDIHGTGKGGRVLKEDILSYAANKGIIKESFASSSASEELSQEEKTHPEVSAAYGWEFEDTTVQLRGFHRAMVKSMTLAAKIPHFHYIEEMKCDALVKLKGAFQNANSDPNVKFTFLPLLIKSLSMALRTYPMLNSCFNEDLYEVTIKGSHNVGIAMATPQGLVVPNIKNVQSLSILEITKELSRLQQLALANKLSPHDITGGTITLSNIGAIGGKFGSPLINVPEVSIIALGRIQKVPQFAEDGNVYPTSVMTVNIGSDHRVLDGATVAVFCNEWKKYIENPDLLMLHMR